MPITLIAILNPQSDGTVTKSLKASDGLTTFPPSPAAPRPCIDGDVLSVQPDGTFQGRVAGTAGVWEKARREGVVLIYSPDGTEQILVSLV